MAPPHPDIRLATACLAGDAKALAELERRLHDPSVRQVLTRFERSGVNPDDILQRVREKLLLPTSAPTKLAHYSGKGSLTNWLRAVVLRTALDVTKRGPPPDEALDSLPELAFVGPDPEWLFLRRRHALQAQNALQAAVEALSSRDLNVLRLHFLDGLNIDAIGKSYGVHRATVARWIAAARSALLHGTRERLAKELNLPPARAASLLRALRSNFRVSLDAWFLSPGA